MKRTGFKPRPDTAKKELFSSLTKTPLKSIGKRGKRLLAGDRKVSASVKNEVCARCGNGPCDAAHIVARDDESVRHLPANILPLCSGAEGCHRWAHDHPAEFEVWLETAFPGRLHELKILTQKLSKSNIGYCGDGK